VPGYDSQAVSEGRHGMDSSLTRAPALHQNIKCPSRGSGCGSGEPARASSEEESRPRRRPALERDGVSPEGASVPRARWTLTRGGRPALKRDRVSPKGGAQPSSEAESLWYDSVPLERSGVSLEGCRGQSFWWAAEVARTVGPCHRGVIVWGVIYDLWECLCFVILRKKMGFPLVI
jgi:hypothetical protein